MENLLNLALRDPLVVTLERMYREIPDVDYGAACLAVVIQQGAERIGVQWDEAGMLTAIKKYWGRT